MRRGFTRIFLRPALAAAACLAPAGAAWAFDFSYSDLTGSLQTQVSVGATMRTQDRDSSLVGKLNLPGQEQFCEDKPAFPPGSAPGINCSNSVDGNAQFLALAGLPTVNTDNGNLNYDKGDLVSAALKVAPRLSLTYGEFGLDVSGVYFYDAVNVDFDEYHPNNETDNNGFQPRNTKRSKEGERAVGSDFRLLDAYVSGTLPLPGGRQLTFKVGNQVLSLGTTTLLVLNGLNTVNPPDVNLRNLPGSDVRDVFRRVPLAVLGTNLNDSLSLQAFYQFSFVPVATPPIGSFFSTNDIIGAGDPYISLLFGKNREDPGNRMGVEERTQGNANQLSDAGRTIYVDPERPTRDQGQYGLSAGYLADWLNNTSFELAYLNLHSRLPTIGFYAAEKGCVSDATNQLDALIACEGFRTAHTGVEPLPIDTVRVALEYPENIHALGLSFSTNLGPVAWTGETVFRPNQPFQVDPVDVGFAALQTVFPAETLSFGAVDIPGRRVATPDYVETQYRGNRNIQPGDYIRGYERFRTLNLNTSFLFLSGASDNPVGADQVTTLFEFGGLKVFGMPGLDELQLAAPGVMFHHSAGVDGTGTPTQTQTETGAQNRLNPHYQESGFADSFSWGYRILQQYAYDDVFAGIRVAPQLGFFHDVHGRSPLPSGEFVQGRKQALAGVNVAFTHALSSTLRYTWYFGGGLGNPLSDRDNIQLNVAYDF
ncbi:MAG TPA: DUF1302 family protein [Solimonas sp.]|nr:DUF1302 family protein [Solimonas sp.]